MPYLISGFDSAGVPCQVSLEDDGTLTGDALLVDWLNAEPVPPPPEGSPEPVPGEPLSEERLEQMRQHVSRLLTYTHIAEPMPVTPKDEPAPEVDPPARAATPPSPPSAPAHRHTHAELEAMNVGELRDLARTAGVVGAASMSKAELVTALSAPHRSGSER